MPVAVQILLLLLVLVLVLLLPVLILVVPQDARLEQLLFLQQDFLQDVCREKQGTLSECQALGPLLYNPGRGDRLRQNDTVGERAGGRPGLRAYPLLCSEPAQLGGPLQRKRALDVWGVDTRGEPSGPLTEAVLVPAVGVAPGHGHGDGAQLAGFGGVWRSRGGRGRR